MLESSEWAILPTVVALLKIFADVIKLCEENYCIYAAIPSAKSISVWSNYRPVGCMWPATVFSVAHQIIQENLQI